MIILCFLNDARKLTDVTLNNIEGSLNIVWILLVDCFILALQAAEVFGRNSIRNERDFSSSLTISIIHVNLIIIIRW